MTSGDQKENMRINISGTHGDVTGVGITGSGNITGKNIVVGDGTINASEQRLTEIQNDEYATSLKEFSQTLNNQLKGLQVSEEQVKSINESIDELAREVKDIKPGKEQEIDYAKQTNIEAKTASVIQKVLDVLPQAAETAATFTPLAPFSKLIGKGIQGIVDAIRNRKKRENA
jgi:hypothetical protein